MVRSARNIRIVQPIQERNKLLPLLGFTATAASGEEEEPRAGWWPANRRRWENGAKNSTEFLPFPGGSESSGTSSSRSRDGVKNSKSGGNAEREENNPQGGSERASEREKQILKAGDGRAEKQKSRRRAAQGRVLGIYKNPGARSDKERLGDAAVLPLFYRRFWSSSEPEHTDSPARKLTLTQTHTDGGRDAAAEEGEG